MLYQQKIDVIRHFSLLNNIVLFGDSGQLKFMCIIKKMDKKIKKSKRTQNEGSIFIQDNDGSYYLIQVTLMTDNLINDSSISTNESFIYALKLYAKEMYKLLEKNPSEVLIKEIDNKFSYHLYDIPAYIWCIALGMITANL
jgi:hypothetical protein